ncbi:AAA family ATPase [Lactobacillus xylocopicola]|uniref:2',3'-cyclic-nucleotide 2'-phosphodiesterase n=1 Tax=Lactobacillus xylocopicola TaxID=2976676 RepID=A0ABM8BHS2_9LACO|nr:AAA family ATPase [Lactobacillus xylocopicola]BDR60849.1 2',3'-cyclic-nucleotide 2'-phosphodiesterase [Lactobacillus xylocopicola]
MRKIFLLRGAPGSGKSSFIARHHLQPYAISRDQIRLLLANLTYYYEEESDSLHQVVPRYANEQTERLVDSLVEAKMKRGETVIVDSTHISAESIDHYQPWVEQYRYEAFIVDLMYHKTLNNLLNRNEIRRQYDWVKPEVIREMYLAYQENQQVPEWAHVINPNQLSRALSQRESNLDHFAHVFAVPDQVPEEDFPHVHISNFYFSFNDQFTERYGTYRNVVTIGKTSTEIIDNFRLPYFVFKFHHKHFLISAYPVRNEVFDPIKKVKGVWTYSTGLVNLADFALDYPQSRPQHVHQFNLSKLQPDRLLHIW